MQELRGEGGGGGGGLLIHDGHIITYSMVYTDTIRWQYYTYDLPFQEMQRQQ